MKRLSVLFLLAACRKDSPYEGAFLQPVGVAVVDPDAGGPFREPIGYIANAHGGEIVPLALKSGRFLTDDTQASFLRSAPLATGGSRALGAIAAVTPDDHTVTVFAGDARFSRLLRVRHVVDVDDAGAPIEYEAALVGQPLFVDADGSGDAPSLAITKVRTGYATSETFQVSYDGESWWVNGSRSGRQGSVASEGVSFVTDRGGVEFLITGTATVGDRFEFTTDGGVDELDVGGVPAALAVRPDQSVLAAIVEAGGASLARLVWIDPLTFAVTTGPELPPTASPSRMTWSADGSTLWIGDGGLSVVWEVRPDLDEVVQHALPWPVSDVASLDSDLGRRLYLVPHGAGQVWVLDVGDAPSADAFVDANEWVPGVQGLDLHEPIGGIEAIPVDYRFPATSDASLRRFGRSVGVALSGGTVVFLDEETSCLVQDKDGPRTVASASYGAVDYDTNFGTASGGPVLAVNGDATRHVVVNPCSGVARTEKWTVTFDAARQGYEVEGTLAGKQPTLAREGTRYLSDDGAVSFLVEPGSTPTQDGWQFTFSVDAGAQTVKRTGGDTAVAFDIPTDPVFFHYRVGPVDNGWDPVDDRPFLLVAGAATNSVQRVEPSSGIMEVDWR